MRSAGLKRSRFSLNNLYIPVVFTILGFISLLLHYNFIPVLSKDPAFVLTLDGDSAGCLRLFDLAVRIFPHIPPLMDYYSSYPWGLMHIWANIWSYNLAFFSVPISKISGVQPAQVAGILVLLLSMAAAIPIYFLAKEIFGRQVALASSFFALFLPRFVTLGSRGIDHHVFDVFIIPVIFALSLASRRNYIEGKTKRFLALAFIAGFLVAPSLLIARSLILIYVMLLTVTVASVFIFSRRDLEALFATLSLFFGIPAAVLSVISFTTPWVLRSLDFNEISYLHVLIFTCIAVFSLIGFYLLHKGIKLSVFRISMFFLIVIASITILAEHSVFQFLLHAFYRSIYSYPIGSRTLEGKSIFRQGFPWIFCYLSYLSLASPIMIIGLAVTDWKNNKITFERVFFYVMIILLALYTMRAVYYSFYFSVFLTMLFGFSASWAGFLLHRLLTQKGYIQVKSEMLAVLAAIVLIVPMAISIYGKTSFSDPDLVDLAKFIKTNTPVQDSFYNPAKAPSYSIMCNWGYSLQLQYLSQRATVSSGDQESGMKGIIASEYFYQAKSEDAAVKSLHDLKSNYVVVSNPHYVWQGNLSKIGDPVLPSKQTAWAIQISSTNIDKVAQAMVCRLFYSVARGTALKNQSPLHHFRLVHDSYSGKGDGPYMLFKLVKGARLDIKTSPHKPVVISTGIIENNGYGFNWIETGSTNKDGLFSTEVPYPTGRDKGLITVKPYKIQIGNLTKKTDISESAIENGEEINLSLENISQ